MRNGENMSEQKPEQPKKRGLLDAFSTFYLIILLIFIVSIWFLFRSIIYYQQGVMDQLVTSLLVSIMGFATSGYMFYQIRKRTVMIAAMAQKPETQTVLECPKCGFKNIRKFTKGDFVFKTAETCSKCNSANLMISSIYQEEEKKKKPEPADQI